MAILLITLEPRLQHSSSHTFNSLLVNIPPIYLYWHIFVAVVIFIFYYIFFGYVGLSLLWPLSLRNTGSGRAGSVAMTHGPSHSTARGIFPDATERLGP